MKLRGLSDRAIRRVAQSSKRAMPFMAVPPVEEVYGGVHEFPGFHTTDTFERAGTYAVGRVYQSFTDEDDDGSHYVTDYPVIVQLDMAGTEQLTDYDAEKFIWDNLVDQLNALSDEVGADDTNEDIVEAAQELMEMSDNDRDVPASAIDFIFEENFISNLTPLNSVYGLPDFPDAFRNYVLYGVKLPDEMLMHAADQYRYTQDISESRLIAVHYLLPVADEAEDYEHQDDEELGAALQGRWPGFDIPWQEDLMGGYHNFTSELVWENPEPEFDPDAEANQLSLPGMRPSSRFEYHGTTYKRLLSAAPELAGVLPAPPSPPYRDVGEGDI